MACLIEPLNCCKNRVDSYIDKKDPILQTISWIFFRIVTLFFPLILGLEFAWNVYQFGRIGEHEKGRQLEIVDLKRKLGEIEAAQEALGRELNIVITERESARLERDERTEGRAKLEREREELLEEKGDLEKRLEKTLQEKNLATEQIKKWEAEERLLSLRQIELQFQLRLQEQDRPLLERIDAALADPKEAGAQVREDRLAITLRENQKRYIGIMRERIMGLKEDDPIRIALEGLINSAEAHQRNIDRCERAIQFQNRLTEILRGGN